ncbi:MAG: hypothetical protein A4E23_01445 [Methanomethylovorans sp. PtaU1.Bin073]|nr:MAG: hypothetical protein A4E23_01445 [Methanomethylovorans sp. PtaU1.Bin073]
MTEIYLLIFIIGILLLMFFIKRIRKTDTTVVHNTYNYGDNIGTQIKDSVIQRSFNKDTIKDSSIVNASADNAGENMNSKDVYNYLLEIARNGCKNNFELKNIESKSSRLRIHEQKMILTYGDVLTKFGKISHNPAHQNELYPMLDEINESTKPVLLSALVVNGESFLPSKPFFSKWVKGMNSYSEQEQIDAWKKELNKIWEHYCDKK